PQRDSWRIHRVQYGDTTASLGKQYGASAAIIATANGGDLPEAGSFAVIPAPYAGDPVRKPAVTTVKKPASTLKVSTPAKSLPAQVETAAPVKLPPQAKLPSQVKGKAALHPVKPQPPLARSKGARRIGA